MLEVVGVTGVVHMGQIQSSLRAGIRIAQGGHVSICTSVLQLTQWKMDITAKHEYHKNEPLHCLISSKYDWDKNKDSVSHCPENDLYSFSFIYVFYTLQDVSSVLYCYVD